MQKQAFILAFSDTFYLLGVALIVALVAALMLKKPGPSRRRRRTLDHSVNPERRTTMKPRMNFLIGPHPKPKSRKEFPC